MARAPRDSFLRRLGKALNGISAVTSGRPVPPEGRVTPPTASPSTTGEPPLDPWPRKPT